MFPASAQRRSHNPLKKSKWLAWLRRSWVRVPLVSARHPTWRQHCDCESWLAAVTGFCQTSVSNILCTSYTTPDSLVTTSNLTVSGISFRNTQNCDLMPDCNPVSCNCGSKCTKGRLEIVHIIESNWSLELFGHLALELQQSS